MEPEDYAWAAGLFEGEGYMCHNYRRADGRRGGTKAGIESTDLDVLERFQDIVKMGKISTRKKRNQRKQSWIWQVSNRKEVVILMNILFAQLGQRRKTQAIKLRVVSDSSI